MAGDVNRITLAEAIGKCFSAISDEDRRKCQSAPLTADSASA